MNGAGNISASSDATIRDGVTYLPGMMFIRCTIALLFALFLSRMPVSGQAIGVNNADALSECGIVLQYQNDAFGNTDFYYSQGVQLAFTHPALIHSPVSTLLFRLRNSEAIYGISLEHDAYTPTSILSDSILYGDRPYAASALVQSFAITTDIQQHARLTTGITLGLIGPGAGGEEIQAFIHRNTNNDIPHGWQYQISNDIILNYNISYERGLLNLRYFTADAFTGAAIGSYQDKAYAGVILKAGWMNLPLFTQEQKRFQLDLTVRPQVTAVGYDATMQGGIFNRNNPYIISSGDVSRITFRNELSISLAYKRLVLSANYTNLTKEFKTGRHHAWGGFMAGLNF